MCANCLTALEATAIQTAGAAVIGQQVWHRVRDAVAGRHPARRAQLVYDRNREFVESLGLTATDVLGARPTAPAIARALVRSQARPVAASSLRIGSAAANG